MNLIFLGPPGSGKGTQSFFLHEKLKVPTISTGSILRAACRKKTPLGIKTQYHMTNGHLVPDDLVIPIVEERLEEEDCKSGYILDGFPRNVTQAEALTKLLDEKKQKLDAVVNINVDDSELIERLTGRRSCRQCGAGYHITFAPPKKPGICDRCGGKLYQRDDDKEETIRNRLKVYKEQTAPLIDYYRQKGLLKDIDGKESAKVIFKRIEDSLEVV